VSHATQATPSAVRASDAEREQLVAALEHAFVAGRLTASELEERAGAAQQARTREQLQVLTGDLPAAAPAATPATAVADPCLRCLLWCLCPPAALVYWLATRNGRQRDRREMETA
jgi:DUF1707 SHOCT-like domain